MTVRAAGAQRARLARMGVIKKASRRILARRYEDAAAAGDADAMVNLARLAEDTDPDDARMLLERAAAAGHPEAVKRLAGAE